MAPRPLRRSGHLPSWPVGQRHAHGHEPGRPRTDDQRVRTRCHRQRRIAPERPLHRRGQRRDMEVDGLRQLVDENKQHNCRQSHRHAHRRGRDDARDHLGQEPQGQRVGLQIDRRRRDIQSHRRRTDRRPLLDRRRPLRLHPPRERSPRSGPPRRVDGWREHLAVEPVGLRGESPGTRSSSTPESPPRRERHGLPLRRTALLRS